MIRFRILTLAVIAAAVAACSPPPPPLVVPRGEDRFLVDPRIGWNGAAAPEIDRAFDTAWRYVLAGDSTNALTRLDALKAKNADYAPAALAEAAIAIRENRLDEARTIVDRLQSRFPNYTAAEIYAAEIDLRQGQVQSAYDRYRAIAPRPEVPPTVGERVADLQNRLFDRLYHAALTAGDEEAIALLRQALAINPAASAARVLLAKKLIVLKRFDEARRELDPLIKSNAADSADVQEALAEIDVGKGRYQQAINRYEHLSRRDVEGRYARRLAQIKEQFAEANMPPQYLRALDAETITRADLAVLMYWKLTSIRFAQDVPAPPIAIDITDVPGREELIRALALGIFQVDPVTRRVDPFAMVTGSALSRVATRVLASRGAPCVAGAGPDPVKILAACGVVNPAANGDDVPVTGRMAAAVLDQVNGALRR